MDTCLFKYTAKLSSKFVALIVWVNEYLKNTVWLFLALVYRPSKSQWPSRKVNWLLFWVLPLAQKHSTLANSLPCDKEWYNSLLKYVISGPSYSSE